jgi:GntR family transcriptional regulator
MHTVSTQILSSLTREDSGVPIYVQLREQLLRAIGAGTLQPGERMPTMREVAVALRVDLNTVRHAYDDLERAGAIVLERGRGSFVAEHPPTTDEAAHAQLTDNLAKQTIATAKVTGIDPAALARRIAELAQQGS